MALLQNLNCSHSKAPVWEYGLGSSSFPKYCKLELAAADSQPGGGEPTQTRKTYANRH